MAEAYPNTFYRVAVKALIKSEDGKILLVKERSDKWDLPGGGLDHGEAPEDGIKRELQEELGLTSGVNVGTIITLKSFWVESKQTWLMWVVHEVTIPDSATFTCGEGVTAIDYINPRIFQTSNDERENYLSVFADLP